MLLMRAISAGNSDEHVGDAGEHFFALGRPIE